LVSASVSETPQNFNPSEAINKKWHPEHFVCGTCKTPFKDGQFFAGDDGRYIPYFVEEALKELRIVKNTTTKPWECCAENVKNPFFPANVSPFWTRSFTLSTFGALIARRIWLDKHIKNRQAPCVVFLTCSSGQNAKPYCKKCHVSLFG
jgi:hypothetical protein